MTETQKLAEQMAERERKAIRDCAHCFNFRRFNEHYGHCKRNPPQVVLDGTNIESAWPIVTPNDWCAQWESSND